MPRDLGDVLHYFLPELDRAPTSDRDGDGPLAPGSGHTPEVPPPSRILLAHDDAEARPAALPLVVLPIGERDVVRAALAWNLAVEIARLGGRVSLVGPETQADAFVARHDGPLGTEVVEVAASNLRELQQAALDVAVARAADAPPGSVVLVRVPPRWLRDAEPPQRLLRWGLLLTSSEPQDLSETFALAKLMYRHNPQAQLGVTIHGARRIDEARGAFEKLADAARRHLDADLTSYGLLVDDLHVYRAIVAQRPIGLAHPQSPAARALRDVAHMLFDRAQELAVA